MEKNSWRGKSEGGNHTEGNYMQQRNWKTLPEPLAEPRVQLVKGEVEHGNEEAGGARHHVPEGEAGLGRAVACGRRQRG